MSQEHEVVKGEKYLDHAHEEAPVAELSRKQNMSSLFTIACAGFALISDGTQNSIMNLTNVVFKQIYGAAYSSEVSTRISNSLTVGTILGQIAIGILCDLKGRKWGIVASTLLIVFGVVLSTAAHGAGGSFAGFTWFMTVSRGMTGVGVGGEYPSSSTSAAEAANERMVKQRGPTFILVTNLVLSLGSPIACILYLIVFEAAGGLNANLSTVWRTVFGITVLPPLIVFYFRLKMLDSKLYAKGAIQKSPPYLLMIKFYWRSLIGTAGAWFLYDAVTFPNGLFSGTIISSIVHDKGHLLIRKTAEYQLLLGIIALPGVFIGALLVNRIGRRNTMMLGFSGYLIFGLSVGLAYDKVVKNVPAFVILYGLMQSSGNLGPGDVLGLASSESYATAVRGTLYGFSAAVGKTGAVVGVQTFTPIRDHLGARWTFIVAAIIGVIGVLITYFFVRNDLGGDLALEDARFAAYLSANGWHGGIGLEDTDALVADEKGSAVEKSPDAVTFPNGLFSGTIISSIVHDKGHLLIRKTAEYQLLLGIIALPGVFIGALLVNRIGRRNTMMLGFSGYLIFGLSVGLAYDKVVKNVPAFVILYGLMQSSGNLGPGDVLGLASSESYATAVRGTLYGLSADVSTTETVVGTQASQDSTSRESRASSLELQPAACSFRDSGYT